MATEKVIVKNQGGIGVCGLLLVVFVTLKLCNVITWPWLWVVAPMWVPLVFGLSILAVVGIVTLIVGSLASKR